jgi:hypothetical protein
MREEIKKYLKNLKMKTFRNHCTMNPFEMSFPGMRIIPSIIASLIFFMCIGGSTAFAQKTEEHINIVPPSWAPHYENVNNVHYYYFPDIECYYDVWNREFVYLEDGSWMFGATLPPIYSWFDLNTSFIVLLDYNVFEPWRHFHYYVSHYPRYYYRTIYRNAYNDVDRTMRGFNENKKAVVHSNINISNRTDKSAIIRNETREEKNNQINTPKDSNLKHEFPERRVEPTRPPHRMEYYGKDIGHPVKVQRNMKISQGSRRR